MSDTSALKTWPERIYLHADTAATQSAPSTDNDVEYVRADLAAAPVAGSEREAFEAHVRKLNPIILFLNKWPDGTYRHLETDEMWKGWQARAALSQPAPLQALADQAQTSVAELQAALTIAVDALKSLRCADYATLSVQREARHFIDAALGQITSSHQNGGV